MTTWQMKAPGQYRPTPIHWPRNTADRIRRAAEWRRLRQQVGSVAARRVWRGIREAGDAMAKQWDAELMQGRW